jgi:Ca-activated chloride channel family protein
VVTDGMLGDTERVVNTLGEQLGEARLLVVGIGSDASRATIQRLADLGRGEVVLVPEATALVSALTRLLGAFSSPVAWDLDVEWGGAGAKSVQPSRVPDIYAGRPLALRAVLDAAPHAPIRVRGTSVDGPGWEVIVPVTPVGRGRDRQ